MAITFTRAWEDDRLDAELLAVAPGSRVLVVAAAGDAALALAADGADVVAVDLNPEQLRLTALKLAAARVLDPETLHRWFEVGRDPSAPAAYRERVRAGLAPEDAAFWDAHIGMVARGLHGHGGVGRPFLWLGRAVRVVRPRLAGVIERSQDPSTQAEFWRRRVRPVIFGRLSHWVAANTSVLAPMAPNPDELERMRHGGWSHGLEARVDAVVASTLVRGHPWWRPAFSGRPADPGDGAAWLDPARVAALAASPRLELVHGDLTAVLRAQPQASLAAISVSNVPDWLDPASTAALAAAVRDALAPGGRVLVRRVVADVTDAFVAAGLNRDPVSDDLASRDRTALYERVDLYRRAE